MGVQGETFRFRKEKRDPEKGLLRPTKAEGFLLGFSSVFGWWLFLSIKTLCESCDSSLKVADRFSGKKIRCPKCGEGTRIPGFELNEEEPEDEELEDEEPAFPKSRSRSRLGKSKPSRSSKTKDGRRSKTRKRSREPRGAKESGGFLSSWFGLRLIGGVIAIVIFVISNLFFGSAAYNTSFAKVKVGMSEAKVIEIMGTPDDSRKFGVRSVIAYEATDRVSRRRSKSTFYVIAIENDKVVEKKRISEDELRRGR